MFSLRLHNVQCYFEIEIENNYGLIIYIFIYVTNQENIREVTFPENYTSLFEYNSYIKFSTHTLKYIL